MEPLETRLQTWQAQLVTRAMKEEYPVLIVAECIRATPLELAEKLVPTDKERRENAVMILATKIAKTARLL